MYYVIRLKLTKQILAAANFSKIIYYGIYLNFGPIIYNVYIVIGCFTFRPMSMFRQFNYMTWPSIILNFAYQFQSCNRIKDMLKLPEFYLMCQQCMN